MTTAPKLPQRKTLALDQIKPYDNNPRTITDEAVEAVKESIERYGYVQPIIVDTDNVIVVGHTRHRALTELDYGPVEVYVMDAEPEKIAQFRLVDNKTGELSSWDMDALVIELREWEESLLDTYFPDVDLEVGLIEDAGVTDKELQKAAEKITKVEAAQEDVLVEVECPGCLNMFKVKASSLPGLSYGDLHTLKMRVSEKGD